MRKISRKNADWLGKNIMLFQTMEECAELIKAISKYNRTRGIGQLTEVSEEEALNNLIAEIADVNICIEQLIYLLNIEDEVDDCINEALEKVKKRRKADKSEIKSYDDNIKLSYCYPSNSNPPEAHYLTKEV